MSAPSLKIDPFGAPVLYDEASFIKPYVPLPDAVGEPLLQQGIRRVSGTINGVPFDRALYGRAPGAYRLVFGKGFLRRAGLAIGEMVVIELAAVSDPNVVDLVPALATALAEDAEAAARFNGFSAGKRRSLNLHVAEARRKETQLKRAYELAYKLRTYTLYGDRADETTDDA